MQQNQILCNGLTNSIKLSQQIDRNKRLETPFFYCAVHQSVNRAAQMQIQKTLSQV